MRQGLAPGGPEVQQNLSIIVLDFRLKIVFSNANSRRSFSSFHS